MFFKQLGDKVMMGGKRLGQKIKAGGKWIGRKLYDNRKEILATMGAAALGYGAYKASQDPSVQAAVQKAKDVREGYAEIPYDAPGEREGYREQIKDVIKAPITEARERAVKAIKRGAKAASEGLAEAGTKLLFHGVPKRHSAELQILERAGLDPSGRPKRPDNGWD